MTNHLHQSQRQKQKARMKPLHIALAFTALTGILVTVLVLIFNVGTPGETRAAGNCSSCTYTVNGNSSANYSLAKNETLCITSGGNFTGTISMNTNSKVCNSGTFAPSSLSMNTDAEIENTGIAVLPAYFNNVGNLINSGNLTFSGDATNSGTFINTGIIEAHGTLNNSSSGKGITNANEFSVTGNFINSHSLVNSGLLSVSGYFQNSNTGSATFTNNDSLFVGSYFDNSQNFVNNDGVYITGYLNNYNTGAAKVYNNGNMYVGGNITSEQLIQNTGRFTLMGSMTMSKSGNTALVNDSIFIIMGSLTSNNSVTNNGYMLINGVYTNERWSGKYVVGPESLLEVDSFYNIHNVERSSMPYGQIIVFNYLSNTGNIASYVDICKVNNNTNVFDVNTGSVDGNVTYCTHNSPLPVELIAFTAKRAEGAVLLEWSTASEYNNRLFEVQRRADDGNFEVIAEVAGAGNSKMTQEYQLVDASAPAKQTLYYRLRQVDNDGEFSYSSIVAVQDGERKTLANEVKLYPNPVSRNVPLRVELTGKWDEANYQVQTLAGTLAMRGRLQGGKINTGDLKPGTYVVKVFSEESSYTTKIVVR